MGEAKNIYFTCLKNANINSSRIDNELFISTLSIQRVKPWHVPSRPPGNLPEVRRLANSWPPRPRVRAPPPREVSRNLTVTVPEPSLSEKSGDTRSRRSF